jgi:hypothetical protein
MYSLVPTGEFVVAEGTRPPNEGRKQAHVPSCSWEIFPPQGSHLIRWGCKQNGRTNKENSDSLLHFTFSKAEENKQNLSSLK